MNLHLTPLLLPLVALLCLPAAGADPLQPFFQDKYRAAVPQDSVSDNRVTAGLLANDRDSAKLGEYTGVDRDQVYWLAGFFSEGALTESEVSYRLRGEDLGLDSRQVLGRLGFTGGVRIDFSYRELPHNQYDDILSPFVKSGDNRWLLPDSWVGADTVYGLSALPLSLQSWSTGTKREQLDVALRWPLDRHWEAAIDYRHERKEGSRLTGMVFGIGGTQMAVAVPNAIDRQTGDLGLALTYTGVRATFTGGYRYSHLDESSAPLIVQNPFAVDAFADIANYPRGFGRIAPAPDNQARTLFARSVWRLGRTTRLSLDLQRSRYTQDQDFLPYSVNSGLETPIDLPATSLDGELAVTTAGIGLSLRPTRRTDLALRYRYHDRDNRTDRLLFAPVINDVVDQGDDPTAGDILVNRPLGSTSRRLDVEAGYRLTNGWKLSAGLEQERLDRQFLPVDSTTERGGHLKLNYRVGNSVNGWLKWRRTERDGDDYNHNAGYLAGFPQAFIEANGTGVFVNDPAMRQFFIADRQRHQQDLVFNWSASSALTTSLKLGHNRDSYDEDFSGLSFRRSRSATLDLGYNPASDLGLFAYLSRAWQSSRQAGYQWLGFQPQTTLPPLRDNSANGWQVDTDARSTTLGTGLNWSASEALAFVLDYAWTKSTTAYGFAAGSNLVAAPLPDLTLLWRDLTGRLLYHWRPDLSLGLTYRYRDYNSRDFAYDGVGVPTGPAVIFSGVGSPDFRGNSLAVSFTYGFQ